MKNFLVAAIISMPLWCTAQSQRLVLLEQFSQASCGICGQLNPGINQILAQKQAQIVAISYQTSWPLIDPMNADNPVEVADRRNFYSVNTVPFSIMDGRKTGNGANAGNPNLWNADTIDAHHAVTAQFEIATTHRLKSGLGTDSVIANIKIKKTGSTGPGTLKLMVAAVEKEINWEQPPGSNGEKKFEMVMKKFLPSTQGITIPSGMAIGDSIIYRVAGRLLRVYNFEKLGVVSFIQNTFTKRVHQASYSPPAASLIPYSVATIQNPLVALSSLDTATSIIKVTSRTASPANYWVKILAPGGPVRFKIQTNGSLLDSILVSVDSLNPVLLPLRSYLNASINTTTTQRILVYPEIDSLRVYRKELVLKAIQKARNLSIVLDGANTESVLRTVMSGRVGGHFMINASDWKHVDSSLLATPGFRNILFFTGAASSDIIGESVLNGLKTHLGNGGSLMVCGQDFAHFLNTHLPTQRSFLPNYLGANYVSTGPASQLNMRPSAPADTFYTGFPASILMVGPNPSPDAVTRSTLRGARTIFQYSDNSVAGIRVRAGGYKAVYFPFQFEAVVSSQQAPLLTKTLDYFEQNAPLSMEKWATSTHKIISYPNPANETITIEGIEKAVKAFFYNTSGQLILSQKLAGNLIETVNISALSNGMYILHIENAADLLYTKRIAVVK